MVHGRLLSALVSSMARRLLATTSRSRNDKEEKNQTKKNSPGYLSLSCASLVTWELPALSRIVVSSRRHRNLISRGANSLRPSLGCTCFRLDQLLAGDLEGLNYSESLGNTFGVATMVDMGKATSQKQNNLRIFNGSNTSNISNISSISNRYSGCIGSQMLLSGAKVSILQG